MARNFKDLSEREILALAISLEEEDGACTPTLPTDCAKSIPPPRPCSTIWAPRNPGTGLRSSLPIASARRAYSLIRRQDVKGFVQRRPFWLTRPLKIAEVRKQAEIMELETRQFYQKAIGQVTDAGVRKLLGDLEEVERKHQITAEALEEKITPDVEKKEDEAQRRLFVLQIVQPGLAGLMDGSVSTLAPVFAAAFATKSSHDALLVGLAASIGAGISMAFAEALSDDGSLTGRGRPCCAARLRIDDRRRWHRTHASIPDERLPRSPHRGRDGSGSRVGHDRLDSESLYGHPASVRRISGRVGGVLVFAVGIWIGSS